MLRGMAVRGQRAAAAESSACGRDNAVGLTSIIRQLSVHVRFMIRR